MAIRHLAAFFADIVDERGRQDEKFPNQVLPYGTGHAVDAHLAEFKKKRNDARAEDGTLTWRDVLLEEVYEAMAESDPKKLRAELVQSAAVIARIIQQIDMEAGE